MFRHLFVPIDEQTQCSRVIDMSLDLACELRARITAFVSGSCFHALAEWESESSYKLRRASHIETEQLRANLLIGQFAQRASGAGVEFQSASLLGECPHHMIAEKAKDFGCDLIVLMTPRVTTRGESQGRYSGTEILKRSCVPILFIS